MIFINEHHLTFFCPVYKYFMGFLIHCKFIVCTFDDYVHMYIFSTFDYNNTGPLKGQSTVCKVTNAIKLAPA